MATIASKISSPFARAELAGSTPEALAPLPESRRVAWLIGIGVFTTLLASPSRLGRLPLQTALKDEFNVTPETMASFFAIASAAIYLRPIAGFLADSVPLLGSRRRYLIASALAGAVLWALAARAGSYGALLAAAAGVNAAAVLGGATIGGVLVDRAHEKGTAGELTSLRMTATNVAIVLAGLLGGWLAMRAIGLTCALGALLMLVLAGAAFTLMSEGADARSGAAARADGPSPVRLVARSPAVWSAAIVSFLFYVAPGFQHLLFYHQKDALQLTSQQIGPLYAINGVFGALAALCYGKLCRRASMRARLVLGILLYALSSCFYVGYSSYPAAVVIEAVNGFVGMLGLMPLHDLAARAAPRGGAALGFALILGIANLGISLSEVIGTRLAAALHLNLTAIVLISAAASACSLFSLPLLPRSLGGLRECDRDP
jgi:predicted MFS family arabinose efflux permease